MVEMSPLDKASLLMCCALLLTFTTAEREYFSQSEPLTWDVARHHCQVCFMDLVTVTPENSRIIIKKIDTDHWIGLRKHFPRNITDNNNLTNIDNNFTNIINNLFTTSSHLINNLINNSLTNNSLSNPINGLNNTGSSLTNTGSSLTNTGNGLTKIGNGLTNTGNSLTNTNVSNLIHSVFGNNTNSNNTSNSTETLYEAWTRWADGDAVTYQNWYPGMPKFKSPIPKINCCSCSCTCPAKPTSIMTSFIPTTDMTTSTTSRFWTTGKSTTEIKLVTTNPGGPLSTVTPTTVTTISGNTTNNESSLITSDQTTVTTTQENTTNMNISHEITDPTTVTTTTNNESSLITSDQTSVTTTQENTTNMNISHNIIHPTTVTTTNIESFSTVTEILSTEVVLTQNLIKTTNQANLNTKKEMEDLSITTDKITNSPTTNNTTAKTTTQRGQTETSTISTTTFGAHKSSTGSPWTTPQPSIEAACEQSPVEMPFLAEINENYIEDSCVVILKFGLWVERRCSEILPFICYEDRFFGHINVTNVTSESATLSWLPGPGDISHYYIEITGDFDLKENLTDLTLDLFNLTAGSQYHVQVFPVKCDRLLNPQNASFYTIPYAVEDLRVENITEKSVFLSWNKPGGKVDCYLVETENHEGRKVTKTELEFDGLIPGSCYTFTVKTAVPTQQSNETSVTSCTKPGKVSNLNATDIEDTSLTVIWEKPEGNFSGFNVKFSQEVPFPVHFVNATQTQLALTGLQGATKTNIQVTVLSNNLTGDVEEINRYTVPKRVSNLELTAEQNIITAKWDYTKDNETKFMAEIWPKGKIENISSEDTTVVFSDLKTATNYTVNVYVIKSNAKSPKETCSIFTLPTAPTKLCATRQTKNSITLTWEIPQEMTNSKFLFNVTSFWNGTYKEQVHGGTSYTFENLTSGTRYDFEVRAEVGNAVSGSANFSAHTEPEEIEITLSMWCSSSQTLYCTKEQYETVLAEINRTLNVKFNDTIHWKKPEKITSPIF